ncbi:MAG: gliding motility-associated C-terminal domain-containing protein [Elusimicrobiales bacterium]|nr:gliding motility-associated C-terminal domain-containing protein [Elusimicrobiales bacterium]
MNTLNPTTQTSGLATLQYTRFSECFGGKGKYISLFFALTVFNIFFAGDIYCAKSESANFIDVNAAIAQGLKSNFSSTFNNFSSIETAAVSTNTSASFMGRSGLFAMYPQPTPINGFEALIISSHSIKLSWTAVNANFHRETETVSRYVLRYSSIAAIDSDADFANASLYSQNWTPLEIGADEIQIVEGFNPATTYYFVIQGVNDHFICAERSNIAYAFSLVPLAPMSLRISGSGNSVSLDWLSPAGYDNRIDFNDRANPTYPYEVMGYKVYEATDPVNGNWGLIADLSSSTLNWTEIVDVDKEYFYHVRAFNMSGLSVPSPIRGNIARNLYFVSSDNTSMIEIPSASSSLFAGDSSDQLDFYTVEISSHPEDIEGKIINSVEFAAYKGGLVKEEGFKLADKAAITMYYKKSGGKIVPADTGADYKEISLYYFNNAKWLQLYGNVDEANQRIQLETSMLGKYQIRAVKRLGAFAADFSGLSNRMLTPNGDGKNDTMVFVFDNPRGSVTKGKIFDIRGAFIAKMTEGEIENSLSWNAKANGAIVPGGVYIYQIEGEGQVYNGTVVVIR